MVATTLTTPITSGARTGTKPSKVSKSGSHAGAGPAGSSATMGSSIESSGLVSNDAAVTHYSDS